MILGLFLISCATLLFEVVLTRIFSVALWGHYAFLVVSLSLLGFGASGSVLHFVGARSPRPGGRTPPLRMSFVLFFLSATAVYLWITRIPFDPVRISWDPWQFVWLSLFYLGSAVPFFFSGLYIGSCFLRNPASAPRLYGINLAGSALGAVLSLVFLAYLPLDAVWISPYKPLSQALLFPNAEIVATRWGPDARVDLIRSGAVRFAPGLSLNFPGELPDQVGLTLDGDRLNAVTTVGTPLQFLSYLPSSAAYTLLSNPEVLVIESGGGLNILEALFHGARSVDAVERNKDVAKFAAAVYSHLSVKRISSHARRYLARSKREYDLISLSLSDSPTAASTGIYGLNENYLYTVEAFRAYLDHLRPDGFFTVTRYLLPPPREEPRTVALALASLKSFEIQNPEAHLILIESYGTWTLLMKKTPVTENERIKLQRFCEERGFTIIEGGAVREPPLRNSLFDLSPSTDDRPFFFHFFQLSKLRETYLSLRGKWEAFFEGGYLVYFALAQAVVWGILLILVPVVVRKRVGADGRAPLRHGVYFFIIGLAFMFVEMAFLQKAVFLFGNPTYGFAILLASLLLTSGIGSMTAGAPPATPLRKRPKILFLAVVSWILVALLTKNPVLSALFGIPLFFFMGFPFPVALSRIDRRTIPLAWAANGIASVIGAILAVVIALEWGYSKTLMGAVALYLISAFLLPPSSEQTERQ